MRILLDTHTFVWWLDEDIKLSEGARAVIIDQQNEIFVSAATAWELATKVRRGRWNAARRLVTDFHDLLAAEQFEPLMISTKHALLAGGLAGHHNDPFDRMLAAQALSDDMCVLTIDPEISSLGARTVW
jgi:PIN domain nuclease of toxin-antitoxin system